MPSDDIGAAKVGGGGGVGDWDLSRLDDGAIAVGGLDGKVRHSTETIMT